MKRTFSALFVLLVAGCLAGPSDDGRTVPDEPKTWPPPIEWSVKDEIDWWEHVSTSYPKHDSNLPTNAMLREFLVAELKAAGFEVEVRAYAGGAQGQTLPRSDATDVHAIVATKAGTTMPDHRIGLVSHYDTQTATIHGAYGDMSGVAAEFALCKALAKVPMERTLACIFFDAEERGLVASQRYVQDVVIDGDEPYVYDIVFGYDMTGINWPGYPAWKMYVMTGPPADVPALVPLAQRVLHTELRYPEEGVEVLDVHDRNSDERRFKEAGIPIYRFAGGRHAADYAQYHRPLDTVEYVYQMVGGRANFEAGFATIVEGSYALILAFDATSMEALRASV
jgi:hypothetical protein